MHACIGTLRVSADWGPSVGVSFFVLGAIRLRSGDRDIALSRPMSRTLLALLLARANRPVSGAQLIEDLWGEVSPRTAKGALRVHLSHLRSTLAEGGPAESTRLETTAAGYKLIVATDELDALRFEHAWRTARQAAEAGAADEVRDLLVAALGWWRGPAYEGLGEFGPLATEAR